MKLTELLDKIGYSYSEGDFRSDVRPPYIAWERETDSITANSVVVYSTEWAVLHLIHGKSDFSSEKHVDEVLTACGIAFTKSVDWIGGAQRVWLASYDLAEGAVEIG